MSEHHGLRPALAEQQARERAELEERDAEWARAGRQRQRNEQRESYSAIDELRAEIAAVREDVVARYETSTPQIPAEPI
jgi:hypothetical protein